MFYVPCTFIFPHTLKIVLRPKSRCVDVACYMTTLSLLHVHFSIPDLDIIFMNLRPIFIVQNGTVFIFCSISPQKIKGPPTYQFQPCLIWILHLISSIVKSCGIGVTFQLIHLFIHHLYPISTPLFSKPPRPLLISDFFNALRRGEGEDQHFFFRIHFSP